MKLNDQEFERLMLETRQGDRDAARKLVELYEPEIRRVARLRMTDPKLRRIVDSMDICQSVFGKFFRNAVAGTLELDTPDQLMGLLVTMTRNRVVDEHRRQSRLKRNAGETPLVAESHMLVEDSPGPETAYELKDLLDQVRAKFSAEELLVADHRNRGQTWEEIAVELDESSEVLRKRLERAISRVRAQFDNS